MGDRAWRTGRGDHCPANAREPALVVGLDRGVRGDAGAGLGLGASASLGS